MSDTQSKQSIQKLGFNTANSKEFYLGTNYLAQFVTWNAYQTDGPPAPEEDQSKLLKRILFLW